MERTKIDLWVGIFVAAGMAALMALALKVGNLTASSIGETYTVTAAFENIGGLKARAPVKSAGVVVGRVDNITFDAKTFEAIVTVQIDKRYSFPKDTFANIYTAGLLGEQYLGLEAGGEEEMLQAGDKIEHTQDAVVLEKMISQFLYNKASETNEKESSPTAAATLESAATVEPTDSAPINNQVKTE